MKNLSFGLILASTLAGGLVAVEVPPVDSDLSWMNRPTVEVQTMLESALSPEDQRLVENLIKSTFSYKLASCLTVTDLEDRCKKVFAKERWKPVVMKRSSSVLSLFAHLSGKVGNTIIEAGIHTEESKNSIHGQLWFAWLRPDLNPETGRSGFLAYKTIESLQFDFAYAIQFHHPLIQRQTSIKYQDTPASQIFEDLTELTGVGKSVRRELADPIRVSLSLKNATPLQALQEIAFLIPSRDSLAAYMAVKTANAPIDDGLETLCGEKGLLQTDVLLSLDTLGKTYLRRFPNTDPTPDKVWTIIEEQAKVILKEAESRPIMVQFFIPEPETPGTKIAKTPVNPPPQENQQNDQQTAEKLAALEAVFQAQQNQNRQWLLQKKAATALAEAGRLNQNRQWLLQQWLLQKKDSPQQALPGVVPPKTPEPNPPVKSR